MAKKGQHIVPNKGGWSVRKAGSSRVSGTYSSKSQAVKEGRKIARNQHTDLFIHGRDGRIKKRSSYK